MDNNVEVYPGYNSFQDIALIIIGCCLIIGCIGVCISFIYLMIKFM